MRRPPTRWPTWGEPPERAAPEGVQPEEALPEDAPHDNALSAESLTEGAPAQRAAADDRCENTGAGAGARRWSVEAVRQALRDYRTAGDEECFDRLHAAAAEPLVRLTLLLTGDPRSAVACVQRAFAAAWDDWPEASADPEPERWVRRAAFEEAFSPWRRIRSRCRKFLRRSRRKPNTGGRESEPERVTEEDRALLAALQKLPRPQRGALVLHDVLGLDTPAVAAETESSTPAAEGRLAAARAGLTDWVPDLIGDDRGVDGFAERLGGRLREAALRGCRALECAPADRVRRQSAVRAGTVTGAAALLILATAAAILATLLGFGPSRLLVDHRPGTADRAPTCSAVPTGTASGAAPGAVAAAAGAARSQPCGGATAER